MARRVLTVAPESLFWYWIKERHRIHQARVAGVPKPWTDDPILRDYKFTNVFRQLDKGTVWLTDHFITPHWDDDSPLLLFNVAWYRLFNWTGTGERLGWQTNWDRDAVTAVLKRALTDKEQVFTGAHMVRSAFGMPKVDSVVNTCSLVWERRNALAAIARFTLSLEAVFNELLEFPYIGGFLAYEIVTDLRHTRLLEKARDINTFAHVGPGAVRGLQRMDPGIASRDMLGRMCELLVCSQTETPDGFPFLELRDIEHSLCEFDKYCRVKFGEGRPRAKYPGQA